MHCGLSLNYVARARVTVVRVSENRHKPYVVRQKSKKSWVWLSS